jgi:hypothetical protein
MLHGVRLVLLMVMMRLMLPNDQSRVGWACGWLSAQLSSGLAGTGQTKTVALAPGEALPG